MESDGTVSSKRMVSKISLHSSVEKRGAVGTETHDVSLDDRGDAGHMDGPKRHARRRDGDGAADGI